MAFVKLPKRNNNRIPTTRKQEYQSVYQDRRWKGLRRVKLITDPVCERCEGQGRTTPAAEVHHVIPFDWERTAEEVDALAFDFDNLLSVCVSCHKEAHEIIEKNNIKGQWLKNQSA